MKAIFTVLLLIISFALTAQWQPTNGPEGGYTSHLRKVSDRFFVNGQAGGIFRSDDGGVTWHPVNNGLPSYPHCYYLTSYENKLYASISAKGIYFSEDLGENWLPINSGISHITAYALVVNGADIYAGYSEGGFFYSGDHGTTWSLHEGALKTVSIRDFVISGNKIFAAVNGGFEKTGVYMSEDKGATWTKLGLVVTNINAMSGYDNALYVSDGTLKISHDYGQTWESAPIGTGRSYYMSAIQATGDEVNVGASAKAIFYSEDEGKTWTSKVDTAPDIQHTAIFSSGNDFWLATSNGVYFSADGGDTWVDRNRGLTNQIIDYLKSDGDTLLAVTTTAGLFTSSDDGASWTQITIGERDWGSNVVRGIHIGEGYKVAGTGQGLFKSSSVNGSWTQIIPADGSKSISTLAGDNEKIVAAVYAQGVYTSVNGGKDWTFKPSDLFGESGLTYSFLKGDTIIIASMEKLFISNDFGGTWETSNLPPLYIFVNSIFFDGPSLLVAAAQGIYKSDDLGDTWGRIDDLPSHLHPEQMVIAGNGNYYVGTQDGVYVSYNKGVNWYPVNTGLRRAVTSLVIKGDNFFSGTFGMGVWVTLANGLNVRPQITQQNHELNITAGENIALTLEDFSVSDPDNESLSLIIGEGSDYMITGNIITPVEHFVGDLRIPVQVDDGIQSSDVFHARVKVARVVGTTESVQRMKVYPNPAIDKIYVEGAVENQYRILLMDQFGKVIHKRDEGGSRDFSVDVSSLSAGLYLLRIDSGTATTSIRISKK